MTQRRAWRLALHPKRGSRIREIKSDRLLGSAIGLQLRPLSCARALAREHATVVGVGRELLDRMPALLCRQRAIQVQDECSEAILPLACFPCALRFGVPLPAEEVVAQPR